MFVSTTRTLMSAAILGSLLCAGATAAGAAAPAGGAIQVFVTSSTDGGSSPQPIVFTGAIGDYGTTQNIDKNGKPDPNGNYGKITLKGGTFEVNLTALNAAFNTAQPKVNAANCSASLSVHATVTLFKGTGMYTGIGGTVHITSTVAFIMPTFNSGAKKGQCNESNNAQPLAQYQATSGTGTVHFR